MIGVIFTGGTIGSRIGSDGFISTCAENGKYLLLEKYYEKFDTGHSRKFITSAPYTILSENLTADYVNKLVCAVKNMMSEDGLTGIIITHGTDTLQYSAAYLYHMLGKTDIPVVLVSSAYVLTEDKENGSDNFKAAVDLIEYLTSETLKNDLHKFFGDDLYENEIAADLRAGVYVSYKNSDGRIFLHFADRLLAHDSFSADVYSCRNEYFATDAGGKIMINPEALNKPLRRNKEGGNLLPDGKKVLFMRMHPNAVYPEPSNDIKAVLFESYHSGTVCSDMILENFCKMCSERGIKIYLAGISAKATQYETVQVYERLHIIPLYDEAPISAYCRLQLEPLY